MEGFIPILLFWLLFSLISTVAKSAKKANQNNAAPAKPGTPVQRTQTPHNSTAAKPAQKQAPKPARPQAQQTQMHVEKPSDAHPFETHMHTPEMDREGEGTEGIDCCHDFMLTDSREESNTDLLSLHDPDESERAQALLQGVIFSEILGRRKNRPYGGKPA